jgi:hypothetical protein
LRALKWELAAISKRAMKNRNLNGKVLAKDCKNLNPRKPASPVTQIQM